MKIKGIKEYNKNNTEYISKKEQIYNNEKLLAGNYICKILNVIYKESSNNKPMLVVYYDIAEGNYKDYYKNIYERNKKIKFKGIYYQSMVGSAFRFYKNMINSIEQSNNIKIDIENGFDSEILKNKLFLGRFGEEEYIGKDKKIKSTVILRYIAPISNKKLPILKIKKLNK